MHTMPYDVLIVGSGASGGWVAKEAAERGLSVLMLEAGPPRVPTRDFTEHIWPYQLKFRGFGNQQQLLENQPVQRLCYACDDYSHQFFVNDHENPYTFPAAKPFMWIRGRQVGGRTFCWARESYRFSDYDFRAASRDGYGEDWPIGYAELAPYYDRVERFIGVSGSREGLEQFPDGQFLPPMALSCGALLARDVIGRKFGWRVMPDRVANLTVNHRGRPACHYCDQCQRGCHTASYFNSPSVTLPAAFRTGRFTLVSDAVVSHVRIDSRGRAEGVHYIDRVSHRHREASARVTVLAAGALDSTRILLHSRSPLFSQGVGNEEGVLGHYLMDHFTVEGGGGLMRACARPRVTPLAARAASSFPTTRTWAPAEIPTSFVATALTATAVRSSTVTRFCYRNSATPGVRRYDKTFRTTSRWEPKASACLVRRTTSLSIRNERTRGASLLSTLSRATARTRGRWPRRCGRTLARF